MLLDQFCADTYLVKHFWLYKIEIRKFAENWTKWVSFVLLREKKLGINLASNHDQVNYTDIESTAESPVVPKSLTLTLERFDGYFYY